MSATAIEEAAAGWLIRREERGWSEEDERAFTMWLDESTAHCAAFWRIEHGWREADRVRALGDARPAPEIDPPVSGYGRSWAGRILPMALAASIVIAIGGLSWLGMREAPGTAPVSYQTAQGGRSAIQLSDGSKVELNTATRLRAAATPDAREVWLDRGEAYFDIVHRPDRRFVVHAGAQTITVLGTRFSVRREGAAVTVAVLSGRVRVEDSSTREPGRATLVAKDNIAIALGNATLVTGASVDKVAAMTAWREGMLVFDATPLGDAVAEFNRYTRTPIRIPDEEVRRIRIGGAFQTRSADAFVDLLRTSYDLKVERRADAIELRK